MSGSLKFNCWRTAIFKDFQGLTYKFKHFPGLEKSKMKFKHFQGFQGPVGTLKKKGSDIMTKLDKSSTEITKSFRDRSTNLPVLTFKVETRRLKSGSFDKVLLLFLMDKCGNTSREFVFHL